MRKAILLMLLFVSLLTFTVACGDDNDDDDDDDSSADDDDDDDNDTGDDDNDDDDDDNDTEDDDDDDDNDTGDDDDDDDDTIDDDIDDDDDDDDSNLWGALHVSEGYTSVSYKGWTYYNGVSASFYDPDDAAGWSDPVEQNDNCARYYYEYPSTTNYTYQNGGTVTMNGANVSPIHLTATAYEYGYYYTADYDPSSVSNLFDPGDALSFSTTGQGDIPGFSGSLEAPMMMEVTQPANFATLTSLPSSAMTFAWDAGNADSVTVMVSTMAGDYDTMTIICTAEDGEGTLTIPGSLMEDLYDDPYSLTAAVTRYRRERTSNDNKDFDFSIAAGRTRTMIFLDE